jgi:hypothetical protein
MGWLVGLGIDSGIRAEDWTVLSFFGGKGSRAQMPGSVRFAVLRAVEYSGHNDSLIFPVDLINDNVG